MTKQTEPTFEIVLTGGLAERNRLPLQHVIDVLEKIQEAVREVGKLIQREKGYEKPDGDFGIDILADGVGLVFRRGSVGALAAITRDIPNGEEAVRRVISTANHLEKKRPASIDRDGEIIVPRLASVADIQKEDRTALHMRLKSPGKKPQESKFSEPGIYTIEALSAPESKVSGITVYGRLKQLLDRSRAETGGKHFWGELIRDNGELWSIKFSSKDEADVIPLFRKRVVVEGDATYFRAGRPRLDAIKTASDPEKDYETAFDELYGCDADIYGKEDFDSLIAEMRGD